MPRAKKIKTKWSEKNALLGFICLVLVVVLIFLVIVNLNVANKRKKLKNELEALEEKITALTEEQGNLQSKIFQSNDSNYLERVAREELGLKKEGESVVAFPIVEEDTSTTTQDPEQQNLWQKIMEKIR